MTRHRNNQSTLELLHLTARLLALTLVLSCCSIIGCTTPPPTPSAEPTVEAGAHLPSANPYAGTEVITKSFEWTYWRFDDYTWRWSVNIPTSLYEHYRAMPRPQTADYVVYATDDGDREIVDDLARTLASQADQLGLDDYERVHFIATFVQKLSFALDMDTTGFDDYGRYPIETLVEERGDCEDTAILLGKIMSSIGYDVVLIRFPDHIALGVLEQDRYVGTYFEHKGKKYFYLETTGEAGRIGLVPPEYKGQPAYIYDFSARPIIVHTWTGAPEGLAYGLNLEIENRGTAPIQGCSVQAGFDAGNDLLWNAANSEPFDLAPGEQRELHLVLTPPPEKHTRLLVFVVHEGLAIDTSQSCWFDEPLQQDSG